MIAKRKGPVNLPPLPEIFSYLDSGVEFWRTKGVLIVVNIFKERLWVRSLHRVPFTVYNKKWLDHIKQFQARLTRFSALIHPLTCTSGPYAPLPKAC